MAVDCNRFFRFPCSVLSSLTTHLTFCEKKFFDFLKYVSKINQMTSFMKKLKVQWKWPRLFNCNYSFDVTSVDL